MEVNVCVFWKGEVGWLCVRAGEVRGDMAFVSVFLGQRVGGAAAVQTDRVAQSNGAAANICMVRHGVRGRMLNRPADQRKASLRGLTTELIRHGSITTTLARCKEVRKTADHIITLAKDNSLHARRQALAYIYDKELVAALFEGVPERYGDRNGGYTRIQRTMNRKGDNAPMGQISLV